MKRIRTITCLLVLLFISGIIIPVTMISPKGANTNQGDLAATGVEQQTSLLTFEALSAFGPYNLWDEEWEKGSIDNNGKLNNNATNCIRSKNYIPCCPGLKFFLYRTKSMRLYYYDIEKCFIPASNGTTFNGAYAFGTSKKAYTVPNGAYYIKFRMESGANGYGDTYNRDISLNYPATTQEYLPSTNSINKKVRVLEQSFSELSEMSTIDELSNRVEALENSGISNSDDLPDDFYTEMETVLEQAQSEDADMRLLVFTDIHDNAAERYQKLRIMMNTGCFDALVGLGDSTRYFAKKTKESTKKVLRDVLSIAGRDSNCLYCVGNHDVAFKCTNNGPLSYDNILTKKELHDVMRRHLNGSVVFDEENPYGGYYYKDFEAAKIRIICLNSSDIWDENGELTNKYSHSLMYQQRQITWFSQIALDFTDKTTPSDWSVLVCAHAFVVDKNNTAIVESILNHVKDGTAYSHTFDLAQRTILDETTGLYTETIDRENSDAITVNADYTVQGRVNVIGTVYGHDHLEAVKKVSNGITRIKLPADNPRIYQPYMTEINGLDAGRYYIESTTGNKYGFTLKTDKKDAKYLVFNNFKATLADSYKTTEVILIDSNGLATAYLTAAVSDYKEGDIINHKDYGDGVVVSVDKSIITVAFKHPYGVRKLMKNHKKLSKVKESD